MKRKDALLEAARLMEDEANELARWKEFTEAGKSAPHRVKVTISNEISRLRNVAAMVKPETPQP